MNKIRERCHYQFESFNKGLPGASSTIPWTRNGGEVAFGERDYKSKSKTWYGIHVTLPDFRVRD